MPDTPAKGYDFGRLKSWVVWAVLYMHIHIYAVVVSCVIIPWFENSVPGVTNLGILTINTAFSIVCYVLCVVKDAGRVPEDWQPDEESNQLVVQVKKKGGGTRFCQKCEKPKPPRCHHCRVCRRCVLRMDHHCPWVNNCIGHGNYKAFFLFLIYITAGVIHSMGLLSAYSLSSINANAQRRQAARMAGRIASRLRTPGQVESPGFAGMMMAFTCAVTFPLTIGLIMLLGWHLYLVICNKTTIEYHEGVTAKIQAAKSGHRYQHPYDVGFCGNLHAVLGANVTCWLLPCPSSADGPGVNYPTGIQAI
mmetsp:Transcript_7589/g.21621  ORF Transcript_7589/g.21621 Transcript_7589/m.21621 type:complete len:306 (+) Transcript_7589:538-1455(+)